MSASKRGGTRHRVPVVAQASSNECGVACVLALLATHGRQERISDIRDVMDVGRNGASIQHIARFLESRQMTPHVLRVKSIKAFEGFRVPVIAHWNGNHFLVVEGVRRGRYLVMDPASGRRRLTEQQFEEGFSGVVLLAVPGAGFTKQRRPVLEAWRSTPLLTPRAVGQLALATVLAAGLYVATLGAPLATSGPSTLRACSVRARSGRSHWSRWSWPGLARRPCTHCA